jgi:hypothetical protein
MTIQPKLPPFAESYIRATNNHDRRGFHTLFADNAIVDDAGRVFRGCDASDTMNIEFRLGVAANLEPLVALSRRNISNRYATFLGKAIVDVYLQVAIHAPRGPGR